MTIKSVLVKVNKKNNTRLISFISALVFILFIMFMLYITAWLNVYYSKDAQTYMIIRDAIKHHTLADISANYQLDCEFDEINTYISGHYDKIYVPVYYDRFGQRIVYTSNKSELIERNISLYNYAPERFDLKGLNGIRCKINVGINNG